MVQGRLQEAFRVWPPYSHLLVGHSFASSGNCCPVQGAITFFRIRAEWVPFYKNIKPWHKNTILVYVLFLFGGAFSSKWIFGMAKFVAGMGELGGLHL